MIICKVHSQMYNEEDLGKEGGSECRTVVLQEETGILLSSQDEPRD
jgi:hypothetical protein